MWMLGSQIMAACTASDSNGPLGGRWARYDTFGRRSTNIRLPFGIGYDQVNDLGECLELRLHASCPTLAQGRQFTGYSPPRL